MATGEQEIAARQKSREAAVHRTSIFVLTKFGSLGILLVWVLYSQFNEDVSFFNELREKSHVLSHFAENTPRSLSVPCLVLLGGSNARQGLSARLISTADCPAINLAVSSELGGFAHYLDWLWRIGVRAPRVVLSSMLMWSDTMQRMAETEQQRLRWIPRVSLITFARNLIVSTLSLIHI